MSAATSSAKGCLASTGSTLGGSAGSGKAAFVTTHWSVVLAASHNDDRMTEAALARLCETYWYPLYAYVRRRGYSVEDAQDLTQEFFAHVLERHWLAEADQFKGRFRTFLLTAMERFLANEWDKARALKRGGGLKHIPIQLDSAETRYGVEPADSHTPEQAFEHRWAVALLQEVVKQLGAELRARGQGELFNALKGCLLGDGSAQPYGQSAAKLGMEEGAVKVAVHRLRQRYRELLRAEIGNTVASAAEVEAEMHHLFNVLTR
jgi:DNA-directed RNA polymerase specialized sigma24 family protein